MEGSPNEFSMARVRRELRMLEGHRVGFELTDGSRLVDCELVSAGRLRAQNVWLFGDGVDTFLAVAEIKESGKQGPNAHGPHESTGPDRPHVRTICRSPSMTSSATCTASRSLQQTERLTSTAQVVSTLRSSSARTAGPNYAPT